MTALLLSLAAMTLGFGLILDTLRRQQVGTRFAVISEHLTLLCDAASAREERDRDLRAHLDQHASALRDALQDHAAEILDALRPDGSPDRRMELIPLLGAAGQRAIEELRQLLGPNNAYLAPVAVLTATAHALRSAEEGIRAQTSRLKTALAEAQAGEHELQEADRLIGSIREALALGPDAHDAEIVPAIRARLAEVRTSGDARAADWFTVAHRRGLVLRDVCRELTMASHDGTDALSSFAMRVLPPIETILDTPLPPASPLGLRWVPASEPPPPLPATPFSVTVPVRLSDGRIRCGWFRLRDNTWGVADGNGDNDDNDVTHWMPLEQLAGTETPQTVGVASAPGLGRSLKVAAAGVIEHAVAPLRTAITGGDALDPAALCAAASRTLETRRMALAGADQALSDAGIPEVDANGVPYPVAARARKLDRRCQEARALLDQIRAAACTPGACEDPLSAVQRLLGGEAVHLQPQSNPALSADAAQRFAAVVKQIAPGAQEGDPQADLIAALRDAVTERGRILDEELARNDLAPLREALTTFKLCRCCRVPDGQDHLCAVLDTARALVFGSAADEPECPACGGEEGQIGEDGKRITCVLCSDPAAVEQAQEVQS